MPEANILHQQFTQPQVPSAGPQPAEVLIVGEAPGVNEVRESRPFVGASGKELDQMLHEAGILRSECRVTNVCRIQPPRNDIKKFFIKHTDSARIPGPQIVEGIELLRQEILATRPKVIIALGETALWALTGKTGIGKWRGSCLTYQDAGFSCFILPTYHPALILRQWSWRLPAVMDLRRAAGWLKSPPKPPETNFLIRPSFEAVQDYLTFMEFLADGSEHIPAEDLEENRSIPQWLLELDWAMLSQRRLSAGLLPGRALRTQVSIHPCDGRKAAWEITVSCLPESQVHEPTPPLHPPEEAHPPPPEATASDLGTEVRSCTFLFELIYDNTPGRPRVRVEYQRGEEMYSRLPGPEGLLATGDIETRGGHIACLGIGLSELDAFCVPFMCVERDEGYWSLEEEVEIISHIRRVFKHPKIRWIYQNGLYDLQYFARYWGVVPKVYMDTMLAHHVCLPGLPKGLDFLSSMYRDYHVYWKDDGKEWNVKVGEDVLWTYNCDDCVATYEVALRLEEQIDDFKLRNQFIFQMKQFEVALRMMLIGVNCDTKHKQELILSLSAYQAELLQWIFTAVDAEAYGYTEKFCRSPKQLQQFFYEELKVRPITNRKTGRATLNDDALNTILAREPVLRPLIQRIKLIRSVGVFLSTFAQMPLDRDGRIRCSFNVAGTETFRYSSSKSAFGSGTNLQNIPEGDEDDEETNPAAFHLPNIRKIFIPDPGKEIADADLDRADAQVVAAEANDEVLREMFRAGEDIHLLNARDIFQNPNLTKASRERQLAKAGVHATNYGAKPPTLAKALGITIREAEMFQRRWFAAHPGIKEWHERIEAQLAATRMVENKFGFRRYYFDRIDSLLPQALAWIPQSTVALVISTGLIRIHEQIPEVDLLIQVHDSIIFQYPAALRRPILRKVEQAMLVEIPYDDPLTIPVGFKVSDRSWGDCVGFAVE